LEAYASGPAIAQRTREALEAGDTPSSLRAMDPADLTAQHVYDAAQHDDEIARDVVRDTARYLGAGVANLLNLFNPEVVVLAGGVAAAGEQLFAPLRAEVRRRAFRPAVDAARIVPGLLGPRAGMIGAVAAFRVERPDLVA
ncbi:MAG: ROK family protein, partial [Gemmatimonadetes bacterium]|nr:ROK family protein [Gemmatimonadota bacterium]